MIVLGLTGGIASGKSMIAAHILRRGIALFDADAYVHQLLERGGEAVAPVAATFPESVKEGAIDRAVLAKIVFQDTAKLSELEHIMHPLVRAAEERFIAASRQMDAKLCVLEIPLLYETAADVLCDSVMVASAPLEQRKARAMARPHMSEEKWQRIIARQLPEEVRARRAEYVIDTSGTLEHTYQQVDAALNTMGV